jgi:hypothetical protein
LLFTPWMWASWSPMKHKKSSPNFHVLSKSTF